MVWELPGCQKSRRGQFSCPLTPKKKSWPGTAFLTILERFYFCHKTIGIPSIKFPLFFLVDFFCSKSVKNHENCKTFFLMSQFHQKKQVVLFRFSINPFWLFFGFYLGFPITEIVGVCCHIGRLQMALKSNLLAKNRSNRF